MTPAIQQLDKLGIHYQVHTYQHDPSCKHYGLEAASALKLDVCCVFKTLIVMAEQNPKKMAVALIPVAQQLSLKVPAHLLSVKKVVMAPVNHVEKTTGYILGGVSPVGQRKILPTYLDQSALEQSVVFVSAGRRGMELALTPQDLISVCQAKVASLCR